MEELVEKAKNKDKNAFSELIINVKKELYLVAKLKLKNEDDISDAIQETLLKSYKNIIKLYVAKKEGPIIGTLFNPFILLFLFSFLYSDCSFFSPLFYFPYLILVFHIFFY